MILSPGPDMPLGIVAKLSKMYKYTTRVKSFLGGQPGGHDRFSPLLLTGPLSIKTHIIRVIDEVITSQDAAQPSNGCYYSISCALGEQ